MWCSILSSRCGNMVRWCFALGTRCPTDNHSRIWVDRFGIQTSKGVPICQVLPTNLNAYIETTYHGRGYRKHVNYVHIFPVYIPHDGPMSPMSLLTKIQASHRLTPTRSGNWLVSFQHLTQKGIQHFKTFQCISTINLQKKTVSLKSNQPF